MHRTFYAGYFTTALAILFTTSVQAETVGLFLGGNIWQNETEGVFGETNTPVNFNIKKEQQSNYFVAVEHPFPVFPNLRISKATIDGSQVTNSTEDTSFTDPASSIVHTATIDKNIDACVNVSYVDYTLYYQLIDHRALSFDLGLTLRDFDGSISITEATTTVSNWSDIEGTPYTYTDNDVFSDEIETEEIEPMLYLATSIGLPSTSLSAFAQGDFLLAGGRSIYNYQLGLSYALVTDRLMDLKLSLGYKTEKMEFEGLDNLYSSLEFEGAFVGVLAHF